MLNQLQPILSQTAKHKKGRKGKSRPVFVSKKTEVLYLTALNGLIDEMHTATADELDKLLKPQIGDCVMVADGLFDRFVAGFANFAKLTKDKIASIAQSIAKKIVGEQKKASDEQLAQMLQKQTGLDLSGLMSDEDIEQAVIEAIGANVALIKSIPQQYLDRVEQAVLTGLQNGDLNKTLADELQKIHATTKSRAELIASDQLGKINSRLSQVRQQKLGITHYVWRTSRDERVRHSHRLRDGKLFAWDDPPTDGHAGQAIRCRCVAEPYTEHLLGGKTPEEVMAEQKPVFDLMQQQNEALLGWLSKSEINHLSGLLVANNEIQAIAKHYDLTLPEQVALRHYTGAGYKRLNAYLRGLSDEHSLALSAQVLRQALNKLPDYQGGIVIRMDNFPEHILKQHTLGNVVEYPAFTSATFGTKDVIIQEDSKIRLLIHSKHAKKIDWISEFSDELEVLFTSPTEFFVKKDPILIDGIWQIELKEV